MSDATEREEPGYGAPRVVLVGESNPYGADPRYALYPLPERASGGRLARILGLTARQYLRAFPHRVNLLVGNEWSVSKARRSADELLYRMPFGSGFVLLGAKVSAAFGVDYRENLLEPRFMQVGEAILRRFWVAVIPHPSGLNRIWHKPNSAELARSAVESLRERVAERADIVASQPSSDLAVTLERITEIERLYADVETGWTLRPLRRVVEALAASDVDLPPAEVAVTQGSGRCFPEGFRAYVEPSPVQYTRVLFRVPHKWRRLRVCLSCSAQFVDVCVEDFGAIGDKWFAITGFYPARTWARDSASFSEDDIVRFLCDLLTQLREEFEGRGDV